MTGGQRAQRVLVFGGTGMLGRAVVREVRRRGGTALGLSHGQGDITDAARSAYWVETFRPTAVVNCAAFTRVDDCESQPEIAQRVNGEGVANLVDAVRSTGTPLVHVSSDYVFDGASERPYREDDPTGPVSVYGASKLAGEAAALDYEESLVVRASWLFGPGGPNFVTTMLGLIERGLDTLRVVDDQRGAPTYTPFLARALVDLLSRGTRGPIHYQNLEPATWYDFSRAIVAQVRPTVTVVPVTTDEFPRPARRPAYSVLDLSRCQQELGRPIEHWEWGLHEYLTQIP